MRRPPLARQFRLAVVLLLVFGTTAPIAADDLGYFARVKVRGEASKALERGELDRAADLYSRVAESSSGDERAEALYFAAVAEIARAGGDRARARQWLGSSLSEAPGNDTAPQARALVSLFDEVAAAQAQVDEAMASVARQSERQTDQAQESAGEVASLSSEIEKLVAELAATKAELKKKDEALEKLKKVVVGGDG